MREWNDVYDENRNPTGRVHLRGTPWAPGDYGLVVCVWVYDGAGHILLTRRAKGKSFQGTWEIPAAPPRLEKPAARPSPGSFLRKPASVRKRRNLSSSAPTGTGTPCMIFTV